MIEDASERWLIDHLRAEATRVKQCYAEFSFRALAIAAAGLALILGAISNIPIAAFASAPLVCFLIAVGRMGIYKYAAANRQHGYELHLSRTHTTSRKTSALYVNSQWDDRMRKVGWEEALRAWRVVQPTLFRQFYRTPQTYDAFTRICQAHPLLSWVNSIRPGLYSLSPLSRIMISDFIDPKVARKEPADTYPWFMPELLTRHAFTSRAALASSESPERSSLGDESAIAVYHAGSYLKGLLGILLIMQLLLLLPLCLVPIAHLYDSTAGPAAYWLAVTLLVAIILLRNNAYMRWLRILEDEMLSIHSCAIVWQVVVLAHFKALDSGDGSYAHYTERLARVAAEIGAQPFSVHAWIAGTLKAAA